MLKNRTRVYGIKFTTSEEFQKKINEQLEKSKSGIYYLPTPIEINAYFKNVEDALRVVDFLNKKYTDRQYRAFPTSTEYLDRRTEFFKNNSQKHISIVTRAKFSKYNIFETAEDYLKKISKIADNSSSMVK